MDRKDFEELNYGDLVAHAHNPNIHYIVTAHYGNRVTAVRTTDLTNPSEWVLVANRQFAQQKSVK